MKFVKINAEGIEFQPESDDINKYLESSIVIDKESPDIQRQTYEIVKNIKDPVEKAETLYEWVRDKIPHSKDINSDIVTCTAEEVLKNRTGICYAKSHLLAAMLRYINIPAGFCYQRLKRSEPHTGFVLHGLNAIFIEKLDRWIIADPRGNKEKINTKFDIANYKPASEIDEINGLLLYKIIFYKPAEKVIQVLKKFNSRKEMWNFLPDSL